MATQQQRQRIALLSVYDKTGLLDLASALIKLEFRLLGSGGTAKTIRGAGIAIDVTNAPEILGGRVKTLHPAVHGGILAREIESDHKDLLDNSIEMIDVVVCNLYPFKETVAKSGVTLDQAVEEIDIGGVTLLRAAAKNHKRVAILSDPNDYGKFIEQVRAHNEVAQEMRNQLALKAFSHTADYDEAIASYFRRQYAGNGSASLTLRYGANPHQKPAEAFVTHGKLPIKVLSGSPGYINLMDALNSWPLVKELEQSTGLVAAASFKHVSPAGAALGVELSGVEKKVYFVEDIKEMSPLAWAYARARGADRMSSFGDWIALSTTCDVPTAKIISREVSDGVIAPGYTKEALDILAKKKAGKYCVLQMDKSYVPAEDESRQVYGITLTQKRNDFAVKSNTFANVVSGSDNIGKEALRDMTVATIALKYTQSNSVCYAKDGMVVGLGAGQQSRIHCTRLAGDKTDIWWMRFHPKILAFDFKKEIKRADKSNAIDIYILDKIGKGSEQSAWESLFNVIPEPLTAKERQQHLAALTNVVISSDAFFPFSDNVHRAAQSGVKYVVAPSGSVQDEACIAAAKEHQMTMVHTTFRLFHH